MKTRFNPFSLAIVASLAQVASGCNTLEKLPYIGNSDQTISNQPKDATQYLCKSGQSFNVRMLSKENAAWVIFPDREVRLEKTGDRAGFQFGNGTAVLSINGTQAEIKDGTDTSFTDCKVPSSSAK